MARFRCYKTRESVALHGNMGDSTPFPIFADVIHTSEEIDVAGIKGISWQGVSRFSKFLAELPDKNFRITNVPLRMFEQIRLLIGTEAKNVKLGDVELKVIHTAGFIEKRKRFSADTMLDILDALGGFAQIDDRVLVGSILHHCKPFLRPHQKRWKLSQFIACERPEEFAFWYLYLSYVHISLSVCVEFIENLQGSLEDHLKASWGRIRIAKEGLSLLNLEDKVKVPHDFDEVAFARAFDQLRGPMEKMLTTLEGYLAFVQVGLMRPDTPGLDAYDLVARGLKVREEINAYVETIEERGSHISLVVMKLACGNDIVKALKTVDPENLKGVNLNKVAEAFNVLDPFAAEAWDTLLPELESEVNYIESSVMNAVFELQGLDYIRQILERRFVEMDFACDLVTSRMREEITFQQAQADLLAFVERGMVSEAEHKAGSYFLGEYLSGDGNTGRLGSTAQ